MVCLYLRASPNRDMTHLPIHVQKGSSFRSGTSRVQGTVVGGMAGMAALKWLGATDPAAQVAVIALWTFACAWHRASSLYGDAAIVAALTLPIIMLGPILGETGALLRVEQTVRVLGGSTALILTYPPTKQKHATPRTCHSNTNTGAGLPDLRDHRQLLLARARQDRPARGAGSGARYTGRVVGPIRPHLFAAHA